MEIQLQELIDQIKKDGVEVAESEAKWQKLTCLIFRSFP
jgi:hypothetical protein